MRDSDDAGLWASLILLALMVVGGLIWAPMTCSRKWAQSGMATSWGPIQGCQVEVSPGRYIPEERIREIDLAPRQ